MEVKFFGRSVFLRFSSLFAALVLILFHISHLKVVYWYRYRDYMLSYRSYVPLGRVGCCQRGVHQPTRVSLYKSLIKANLT